MITEKLRNLVAEVERIKRYQEMFSDVGVHELVQINRYLTIKKA